MSARSSADRAIRSSRYGIQRGHRHSPGLVVSGCGGFRGPDARHPGRCALASPAHSGFSGEVFIADEVLIGTPVGQARQRLLAQVGRDELHAIVAGAFADRDRLPGSREPTAHEQTLTVHTLPSYLNGPVTVIPLRWYTSPTFDEAFPVVDANIELQQAEPETSRLGVSGIYHPTTGQPSTSTEQNDVRATVRQFLERLANILTIDQAG